jgi:hypothetical protein
MSQGCKTAMPCVGSARRADAAGSHGSHGGTPKAGHAAGDMPARRSYAINLKLLDDYDVSSLTAEKVDGRNNW